MMKRIVALALAMMADEPAFAMDESVLSCVDRRVSAETIRDMMADVIFDDDWTDLINQDPPDEVKASIAACADNNFLPGSARAAYFDYSLNRLINRDTARSLRANGIKPEEVDRALGLGLGLANPLAAEVDTEAKAKQLNDSLNSAVTASGTTTASLLPITMTTLAAYAEASARMYRAQARLP